MNGLTKVEEFVLCVITVVVTAITFINVLSRFVFHSNFAWSEELVINVFILMIMLGCALATRDGSMITLSLIFDNVGVGGKKILTVTCYNVDDKETDIFTINCIPSAN